MPAQRSTSKRSSLVESVQLKSTRVEETALANNPSGVDGGGGGAAVPKPPSTTSAKGCGPVGTLKPRTSTVQLPVAGDWTYTFSRLFTRSADPPVCDQPPAKTLPRYWVPSGAVTTRSRSLTRFRVADVEEAGSLHASVTLTGE